MICEVEWERSSATISRSSDLPLPFEDYKVAACYGPLVCIAKYTHLDTTQLINSRGLVQAVTL